MFPAPRLSSPRPRAHRTFGLCVLLAGALLASAREADQNLLKGDSLRIDSEAALFAGDPASAESLFAEAALPAAPGPRHRYEILAARLAAGHGDWKGAEARLRAWNRDPVRRTGTGEILFWRGWAALHQDRADEADSLFVLASAYTDEARSQDALEYRFVAMMEPSPAVRDYVRGLPESPLPLALRIASLERVPKDAPLYPYALWRLAALRLSRGDSTRARETLRVLVKTGRGEAGALPVPVQKGRFLLARLTEAGGVDSAVAARAAYEELLVRQQRGVVPESARKRVENLRAPENP